MLVRLPVSPSTNNLFQNVPGRGRVPTRQYSAWKQEAGWALKLSKPQSFGTSPVQVGMIVPRKPASRDIDNFAKAILDLLTAHQVIADDRFIERLEISRHDDADILLTVMPYSSLQTQGGK